MNCIENKMSCNFSALSQTPSISDIIQPLKISFLSSDYDAAELQLVERENNLRKDIESIVSRTLRAKCDALEFELDQLKTQKYVVEEEHRRLKRDYDENELKYKDLTSELCLIKDKSVKRYDALLVKVREWEASQIELLPEMGDLRDEVEDLKGKLRVKEETIARNYRKIEVLKGEKDKLEEICRENEGLKEEIGKVNAHVVEMRKEEDEKVKELLERIESEMKRVEEFEEKLRVCSARFKEIEGIKKKNASLEEEKAELGDCVEELKRNDTVKSEEIKELLMKNEVLNKEKYDKIHELDKEKKEAISGFCRKIKVLEDEKEKLNTHVEKLEEICRENEGLKEEIGKLNAHVIEMRRNEDEEVTVFLERIESEMNKNEKLEEKLKECMEMCKEIEGIRKKNAYLEEEKTELGACVEELRRNDAAKTEKIKEFMMKNEVLDREKREIAKEKDEKIHELEKEKELEQREMTSKYGRLEDRLLKLEENVVTCFCINLKREMIYSSNQLKRIFSQIEHILDCEEVGITCKAQGGGAVCTPSTFGTKRSRENGPKETAADNIVILDSDDDNENPVYISSVKNKHGHFESLSEQCDLSSSDDSLNPKHKKKKLDMHYEPANLGSSALLATSGVHRFSKSQRKTLETIRRCEESLRRDIECSKDGGPSQK